MHSSSQLDSSVITPHHKRQVWIVCALSLAIGLFYVSMIRAGLPYDEPAHWNIVQQWARGNWMPVMGTPGVSYEAYQAPGFYALAGLITFVTQTGGESFAFYILRGISLLLILPTIWLCYSLSRRVFPADSHRMALLLVLFIALNPVLLAIYASVQNDACAIVISLVIMTLTLRWIGASTSPLSLQKTVMLGALVGLAILFKLTTAYTAIAVPIYFFWTRRNTRETLHFLAIFFPVVFAVAGWWLWRNNVLYGDFSGAAAMQKWFPEGTGEPVNFADPRNTFRLLRNIINYLWSPAEYFRNAVEVSRITKLLIALAMLFAFVGWVSTGLKRNKRQSNTTTTETHNAIAVVTIFYAVCLAVYVRGIATQWGFPARMTLVTVIAPALFIVAGGVNTLAKVHLLRANAHRIYGAFLIVTMLFINVSMLRAALQLPSQPYDIKFPSASK